MLIYNTTFLVSDRVYGQWLKWLKEIHIPNMLDEKIFSQPQVAKVLTGDSEQEGTSVSVQFHVKDVSLLQIWDEKEAETLFNDLQTRFGTDVLTFSTVLEILE